MPSFLKAVVSFPFLYHALLGAVLGSVAAGIAGAYVVSRRMSYIAAGIAHFVLGGIGLARYLAVVHGFSWLRPFHGAVAAAILGSTVIALVERVARERRDTAIGAVWAVGMAVGVVAISATPGYNEELVGYLFGNILFITPSDLYFLAVLDVCLLGAVVFLYRHLLALCFDSEWAELRGVPVTVLSIIFLWLISLTVVALLSMVGVVMVIALLTLPAAVAGKVTRSWGGMMAVSGATACLVTVAGLWIGYDLNWPTGAATVILAGILYGVCLIVFRAK